MAAEHMAVENLAVQPSPGASFVARHRNTMLCALTVTLFGKRYFSSFRSTRCFSPRRA
jgi:hypothetical protein